MKRKFLSFILVISITAALFVPSGQVSAVVPPAVPTVGAFDKAVTMTDMTADPLGITLSKPYRGYVIHSVTPATGIIDVKLPYGTRYQMFNFSVNSGAAFTVYNTNGASTISANAGSNNTVFGNRDYQIGPNSPGWAGGTYFVDVTNGGNTRRYTINITVESVTAFNTSSLKQPLGVNDKFVPLSIRANEFVSDVMASSIVGYGSGIGSGTGQVEGPGSASSHSGRNWQDSFYGLSGINQSSQITANTLKYYGDNMYLQTIARDDADSRLSRYGINGLPGSNSLSTDILRFHTFAPEADNKNDGDRGAQNSDRQRLEIKTNTSANNGDANMTAGEIHTAAWKVLLPAEMVTNPNYQSSNAGNSSTNPHAYYGPPGFWHIYQLKAINGDEAGQPVVTITFANSVNNNYTGFNPHAGTGNAYDVTNFSGKGGSLELRTHWNNSNGGTNLVWRVPISVVAGRWLEVELTMYSADEGYIYGVLKDVETGQIYAESGAAADLWRRVELSGSTGGERDGMTASGQQNRHKWGIYRGGGLSSAQNNALQAASMYIADLYVIERDPAAYVFPDGFNPRSQRNNIVAYTRPAAQSMSVARGTPFTSITGLPAQLTVLISNGKTVTLPVTWNEGSYDPYSPDSATQTITASFPSNHSGVDYVNVGTGGGRYSGQGNLMNPLTGYTSALSSSLWLTALPAVAPAFTLNMTGVAVVDHAYAPTIIVQPQNAMLRQGVTRAVSVTANAGDGGTLTYQWYLTNGDESVSIPIPGAIGSSYAAPIDIPGEYYYYVIITNTNPNANITKTNTAKSNLALLDVQAAPQGTIIVDVPNVTADAEQSAIGNDKTQPFNMGDPDTRWAASNTLSPGSNSVGLSTLGGLAGAGNRSVNLTIPFDDEYLLESFDISFYSGVGAQRSYAFNIFVSDDGANWTKVNLSGDVVSGWYSGTFVPNGVDCYIAPVSAGVTAYTDIYTVMLTNSVTARYVLLQGYGYGTVPPGDFADGVSVTAVGDWFTVNLLEFYGEKSGVTAVPVTGVSLNKSSTTIPFGEFETLVATVAPSTAGNKLVTWTSSDPDVAYVFSNGMIAAITAGTTTITVTTAEGGFTADCIVTVDPPQAVTGISLNKSVTTIPVGGSETLTATITPPDAFNKTVIWSSNNAGVTVVNGIVTVLAAATPGTTAMIRAESAEDPAIYAECTVTIDPPVAVINISLNKTTADIEIGKTEQLTATITPPDAFNKAVTWSSNNANVTVNSTGLVSVLSTATADTTATIKVESDENPAIYAECVITIKAASFDPNRNLTLYAGAQASYNSGNTPAVTAGHESSYNVDGGRTARYAFDGNYNGDNMINIAYMTIYGQTPTSNTNRRTYWQMGTGRAATDWWIMLNYTSTTGYGQGSGTQDGYVTFDKIILSPRDNQANTYKIEVRNSTTDTWTEIYTGTFPNSGQWTTRVTIDLTNSYTARFVRFTYLTLTGATNVGLQSFELYYTGKPPAGGNVPVTGIDLNKTTTSIEAGKTEQLTATVAPANATNKNVTWESQTPSVATVSNTGLVTALTTGNAIIIATAADTTNGTLTAQCSVTVTEAVAFAPDATRNLALYAGSTLSNVPAVSSSNRGSANVGGGRVMYCAFDGITNANEFTNFTANTGYSYTTLYTGLANYDTIATSGPTYWQANGVSTPGEVSTVHPTFTSSATQLLPGQANASVPAIALNYANTTGYGVTDGYVTFDRIELFNNTSVGTTEKYTIEVSNNGVSWTKIVNASDTTQLGAAPNPRVHTFNAPITVRYIRYVVVESAGGNNIRLINFSLYYTGSVTGATPPTIGSALMPSFINNFIASPIRIGSAALNSMSLTGTGAAAVTVTSSAGGSVAGGTPAGGSTGNQFVLTATPNANYTFIGWYDSSDNLLSADNPYILNTSVSIAIKARFEYVPYVMGAASAITLSANPAAGGTVSGGGLHENNKLATVTAAANTGYVFAGWYESGSLVYSNTSYTFNVTGDRTLEARFTNVPTVNITATAGTGGSVTGGGIYNTGASVSLTAAPHSGYSLEGWYESGIRITGGLIYTFTAASDRVIEARFSAQKPKIPIDVSSPELRADNYQTVTGGDDRIPLNAISDDLSTRWAGYISSPTTSARTDLAGSPTVENGVHSTNLILPLYGTYNVEEISIVFDNDTGRVMAIDISTSMDGITWTKATLGGDATAGTFSNTSTGNNPVNCYLLPQTSAMTDKPSGITEGRSQVMTVALVTPAEAKYVKFTGYGWISNNNPSNGQWVSLANISLYGTEVPNNVTFSVTGGNGTLEASGTFTSPVSVSYGASVVFIANPANGYHVKEWKVNGIAVTGYISNVYTLPNVTAAMSVTVEFELIPPGMYEVEFEVLGSGGTLTATVGGTEFLTGELVTEGTTTVFTAVPDTGYRVKEWTLNGTAVSGTNLTYTLSGIAANYIVMVAFEPIPYTVTVVNGSGGGDYNIGVNVTLEANTAPAGYYFDRWVITPAVIFVSGTGLTSEEIEFIMPGEAVTAAATYALLPAGEYSITVLHEGNGVANPNITHAAQGTIITLTATPDSGHRFVRWEVISGGITLSSTMTAAATFAMPGSNVEIKAIFEIIPPTEYRITVTAGIGGAVTGGGTYTENSSVTLNAAANTNYEFDGWYEGGTRVSSSALYTFSAAANRTLEARFIYVPPVQTTYTLTVTSDGNGSVFGSGTYTTGTQITLNASAYSGYEFDGWYENGSWVSSSSSYTITVTSNRSLQARFIYTYTDSGGSDSEDSGEDTPSPPPAVTQPPATTTPPTVPEPEPIPHVTVEAVPANEETVRAAENAVESLGIDIAAVSPPMTVTVGSDSTIIAAVNLPENTDTLAITTMAVLNEDGTLTAVPTRIDESGNVQILISADILSSVSGDITLVGLHVEAHFTDISGHTRQVQDEINLAASMMIVQGRGEGVFDPSTEVTTQEAATMFLRALGVPVEFDTAMKTALEHDLITADAVPEAPITRIDAAQMIVNSLEDSGINRIMTLEDAKAILEQFTDLSGLTDEQLTALAITVELGIFRGAGGGLMNPNAVLERSHMASLTVRMQDAIFALSK